MTRRPALSKGETEVARAIWELGEATVGKVYEWMSQHRDIDYSTVQTYIRRLESKGYISAQRIGRNKIYRPKVRPGLVIGEAIDELMNRLFDGQLMPLMRHLIHDRGIGDDEIRAVRDLLDAAEDAVTEEHHDADAS